MEFTLYGKGSKSLFFWHHMLIKMVNNQSQLKNDDSVKEAPAYCQSFLDGLPKCFVTFCNGL